MSPTQSSWVPPGCRPTVSDGTARWSTLKSVEYSRHGSAITASAIHSRRPALAVGALVVFMPGKTGPGREIIGGRWSPARGRDARAGLLVRRRGSGPLAHLVDDCRLHGHGCTVVAAPHRLNVGAEQFEGSGVEDGDPGQPRGGGRADSHACPAQDVGHLAHEGEARYVRQGAVDRCLLGR